VAALGSLLAVGRGGRMRCARGDWLPGIGAARLCSRWPAPKGAEGAGRCRGVSSFLGTERGRLGPPSCTRLVRDVLGEGSD